MATQGGHQHATLAIKVLAWAVQTSESTDGGHPALIGLDGIAVKVAEALVCLVRSEFFHEPWIPSASHLCKESACRFRAPDLGSRSPAALHDMYGSMPRS